MGLVMFCMTLCDSRAAKTFQVAALSRGRKNAEVCV